MSQYAYAKNYYDKNKPSQQQVVPKIRAPKDVKVLSTTTAIKAAMPLYQKFIFNFEDIQTTSIVLANNQNLVFRQFAINNLNALDTLGNPSFPSGYSNWSRFYNNFLVHSAKFNVEFVNNSSIPVYAVVAFRPIRSETTWNSWAAWRNLDSNCFPNKQTLLTAFGGSKDRCVIEVESKLSDLFGRPDSWNALQQFSGSTDNTAPTQLQDAFIAILTGNSSPSAANVTVKISIQTVATLYQLKTQFNGSSA